MTPESLLAWRRENTATRIQGMGPAATVDYILGLQDDIARVAAQHFKTRMLLGKREEQLMVQRYRAVLPQDYFHGRLHPIWWEIPG